MLILELFGVGGAVSLKSGLCCYTSWIVFELMHN